MASFTILLLVNTGLATASSISSTQTDHTEALAQFEVFKAKYGRTYSTAEEEQMRLEHFHASLARIHTHNSQKDRTYDKGLNQFSDLSDSEFSRKVLMEAQNCSATHKPSLAAMKLPKGIDLPARVDWRERGVISEAFDNDGCKGGLPSHAFEYIKSAGGLDTEFHYPYKAVDATCAFAGTSQQHLDNFEPTSGGIGAQVVGGSVNLTVGDEDSLKYILATHGPVSIAFQVAKDFRDYHTGVYTSQVCRNGPGDVNHAVLAVGYGTDPNTQMPYWLVKNSWDYYWGDEGFFKIEAFKNMCGVADCMAFPDLYGTWNSPSATTQEAIVV